MKARIRAALSLADSPIGAGIPPVTAIAMVVIALIAVALDLELLPWSIDYDRPWLRVAPAALVLIGYAVVCRTAGGLEALGLRARPLPSLRFWMRATVWLLAVGAVMLGIGYAIYLGLYGATLPADAVKPRLEWLPSAVVESPLVEELIYRCVLVGALAALLPRRALVIAILVSGVAFGYLHVVYGVAAPNNVAAGFLFAWMYLRSGSIAVPIFFHSLGNLLVTVINAIGYALLS